MQFQVLSLNSYVTLCKLFNLNNLHRVMSLGLGHNSNFPNLENKIIVTSLYEYYGLNEIIYVNCLEYCLACNKCLINIC